MGSEVKVDFTRWYSLSFIFLFLSLSLFLRRAGGCVCACRVLRCFFLFEIFPHKTIFTAVVESEGKPPSRERRGSRRGVRDSDQRRSQKAALLFFSRAKIKIFLSFSLSLFCLSYFPNRKPPSSLSLSAFHSREDKRSARTPRPPPPKENKRTRRESGE